jgi:hypothetical protein
MMSFSSSGTQEIFLAVFLTVERASGADRKYRQNARLGLTVFCWARTRIVARYDFPDRESFLAESSGALFLSRSVSSRWRVGHERRHSDLKSEGKIDPTRTFNARS